MVTRGNSGTAHFRLINDNEITYYNLRISFATKFTSIYLRLCFQKPDYGHMVVLEKKIYHEISLYTLYFEHFLCDFSKSKLPSSHDENQYNKVYPRKSV